MLDDLYHQYIISVFLPNLVAGQSTLTLTCNIFYDASIKNATDFYVIVSSKYPSFLLWQNYYLKICYFNNIESYY